MDSTSSVISYRELEQRIREHPVQGFKKAIALKLLEDYDSDDEFETSVDGDMVVVQFDADSNYLELCLSDDLVIRSGWLEDLINFMKWNFASFDCVVKVGNFYVVDVSKYKINRDVINKAMGRNDTFTYSPHADFYVEINDDSVVFNYPLVEVRVNENGGVHIMYRD